MQVLRLHLGKACPGNPNRALRKAVPFIEPVSEGGKLRWSLTRPGVARLEELTFLQLGGEQDLVVSISISTRRFAAASEKLFREGNYPEAVGRAAKQLNAKVRNMTGRLRDDGVRMMHQTFAPCCERSARLLLGSVSNDWERDRQEGFGFINGRRAAGHLERGQARPPATSVVPRVALEMLAMFSFLARTVDACTVATPTAATG